MKASNARNTGPRDLKWLPVPDDLVFTPTDHRLVEPAGRGPEPMDRRK